MQGAPLGGPGRRLAARALFAMLVVAMPGHAVATETDDEVECLARAIYHEARGEDREGRVAVAHAVLNRRGRPQFKPTICEVIRQGAADGSAGCQFSWACDGKSDVPRDETLLAESRAVAQDVLAGRVSDPTEGAMWFHAGDAAAPDWAKELRRTAKLGNHVFYTSPLSAGRGDGG